MIRRYCPNCGNELSEYYGSIFSIVRGGLFRTVKIRQADCSVCNDSILTPESENLIDDTIKYMEMTMPIENKLQALLEKLDNVNIVPSYLKDICIQYISEAKGKIEILKKDCGNLTEEIMKKDDIINELKEEIGE